MKVKVLSMVYLNCLKKTPKNEIIALSSVIKPSDLILNKLKMDPANGSGPFVTMANDMFSAISYLFIALLII